MNHILMSTQDCESGFLSYTDHRTQHITHILKLKENDCFKVGVKNTGSGTAKIISLTKEGIFFTYEVHNQSDTLLPITLILGSTRPPVLQRLLRDITTFGVQHIIIVHTQNSEKSYLLSHLWRNQNYQKYIDEGMSLARSVCTPQVTRIFNLKNALSCLTSKHRILADQHATQKLSDLSFPTPFTIAVGPERGFTALELLLLKDHGFQSGHLGSRILRSENSCMIALTLCAHTAGLI